MTCSRRWSGLLVPTLIGLSALAVLGGCSNGDDSAGSQNVQVPSQGPTATLTNPLSVNVVDAATGALVSSSTVTIGGANASSITNSAGTTITSLNAADGTATALVKGSPTTTAPIVATFVGSAANYVSSSTVLTATAAGTQTVTIRLVKIATNASGQLTNTPTGVTGQVTPINTSNGTTTTAMTIATPPAPDANGAANGGMVTLAVPTSTTLRGADGTPATGAVTTTVAFYSNGQESSLSSFPGGLTPTVANATGGNTVTNTPGSFISAGFTAIQMKDAAGKPITQFSQPVTATIEVPKGTVDPATGAVIGSSSTFPIWSYDEGSGVWTRHTLNGNVEDGLVAGMASNGNYLVNFRTTHLSYYNADFFVSGQSICNGNITLSSAPGTASQLIVTSSRPGYVLNFPVLDTDTSITLFNLPRNYPLTFQLVSRVSRTTVYGTSTTNNVCAGVTIPVNVPQPSRITATVNESCPGGGSPRAVGGQEVQVFSSSTKIASGYTDSTGAVSFGLPAGTYGVNAKYSHPPASGTSGQSVTTTAGATSTVTFNFTQQCATATPGGG